MGSRCPRIRRPRASFGVRAPAATAPLPPDRPRVDCPDRCGGMFSASQSRGPRGELLDRLGRLGRGRGRFGHDQLQCSSSLGERVDAQVVFFGRAEHRAVQRDSAQEQMQVVLPRHPDTAVQLNAVLQHAGSMFTHIGFRDADGHVGARRTRSHLCHRGVRRCTARLEPDLQVRVFVFERLVGADRTAEGMPVESPLDGEGQHRVENAHDLGALQHLRDLALPGDQPRGLLGRSDRRGLVDLDAVEMHTGIALHQVDRPLRLDVARPARPSAPGTGVPRPRTARPPAGPRSRRPPRRDPSHRRSGSRFRCGVAVTAAPVATTACRARRRPTTRRSHPKPVLRLSPRGFRAPRPARPARC